LRPGGAKHKINTRRLNNMERPKIDSIKIIHAVDEYPDLSYIGKYTDDMEPGVIVREYGEFYEKLPAEMERDTDGRFYRKGSPEVPARGREYRGFRPYAGGEKPGTKDYYKYGMQDFKQMEDINNGYIQIIGIYAKATVSYEVAAGGRRIDTLESSGLWGIEEGPKGSKAYIKEIEQQQLDDLKEHLEHYQVDMSNFKELAEEAIDEPVYK
jgi:hypothetical protein